MIEMQQGPGNIGTPNKPAHAFWAVTLRGDDWDKAAWERSLDPRFGTWIEYLPKPGEKAFRAGEFEKLATSADVWEAAQTIFRRMNGIIRPSSGTKVLYPARVCEVLSDGEVRITTFAIVRAEGRSDVAGFAGVIVGGAPSTPQPSRAQRWLAAAAADKVVADMLENFGEEPTWVSLYKTYDGIRALAKRTGGFKTKSWYPGDDLNDDFRDNANHRNRHGLTDHSPPPDRPMDLSTARDLVSRMLTGIMSEIAP